MSSLFELNPFGPVQLKLNGPIPPDVFNVIEPSL